MRAAARASSRNAYPQANYLRAARGAAAAVTLSEADRHGLTGTAIGERLRAERLAAIKTMKAQHLKKARIA